uniref:Fip1 domain-containing protein n=1 Tax=Globodera pallida TaxID=36090 RepID=A0A183C071_GLOPA
MSAGNQNAGAHQPADEFSSQQLLPKEMPGLEFVDPDEIPLEVYRWMPARQPAPRPPGMTQWEENSQPAPKPWSKAARGERDSYDEGDDSAFFPPSTSRASQPQEEDVVFVGEFRKEEKNSLDDPEFFKALQQMEEEEKARESRQK